MTTTHSPAGEGISLQDGHLVVPDHPVIPFIEGDGTGPDIWRSSRRVFDAAVERAYRTRHASALRCHFHATARREGHGDDQGVFQKTIEQAREFINLGVVPP